MITAEFTSVQAAILCQCHDDVRKGQISKRRGLGIIYKVKIRLNIVAIKRLENVIVLLAKEHVNLYGYDN